MALPKQGRCDVIVMCGGLVRVAFLLGRGYHVTVRTVYNLGPTNKRGRYCSPATVSRRALSMPAWHSTQHVNKPRRAQEASRPYGEWPAHRPDPWHTERPNTDPIQTAAQVAALMARVWADSLVLPYDPVALSEWIMKALKTFEARHVFVLGRSTLSIDSASKAAEEFYHATVSFVEYVNKVPRENPLVTRMINDIMRSLEKVFTIPGGVPTRHVAHRSILYSPEGLPFPGLEDLVRGAPIRKDAFNKHLTLITEAIIQATELLIATPF
ncbi:uncharacterized protein LOC144160639 [Haemaphysalis longicornis]